MVFKTYICDFSVIKQEHAYWVNTYCDSDTDKVNEVFTKCLMQNISCKDGTRPVVRIDKDDVCLDLKAIDSKKLFNKLFVVNNYNYDGNRMKGKVDLSIKDMDLFRKFHNDKNEFTITLLYIIDLNGKHSINISINKK